MQVGSASALNILRNTYSADNLNISADSTSARLKILQNAAKAQESLRESMATSAEAGSRPWPCSRGAVTSTRTWK